MPRSHESYSSAAQAGWESRWDALIEAGEIDKLGPKGMAYYLDLIAQEEEDAIIEDYEDFEVDEYEEPDSPPA